jgi:hypothetical protein
MERSSGMLQESAEEVLSATMQAANGGMGGNSDGDTVSISDAAFGGPSMTHGLLNGRIASLTYEANTQVVRSSDEAFQALLDVVIGP